VGEDTGRRPSSPTPVDVRELIGLNHDGPHFRRITTINNMILSTLSDIAQERLHNTCCCFIVEGVTDPEVRQVTDSRVLAPLRIRCGAD
jgi:hypothetical protein